MMCTHEEPDTWFDRELCPPPCGWMHDRCVKCGLPVDVACAFEVERLAQT
jgi:hypothetical protein